MASNHFKDSRLGGRIAFEVYLRTGKIVEIPIDGLEVKFNPWHDPEDGRFTFAGQGNYFGGGGGGHNY